MAAPNPGRASNSPIAQALGDDFNNLHAAVRKHYAEAEIDIRCTMDVVFVKGAIKPLALVSYRLLGAPVPHSGRDVEIAVRNRTDGSGVMHWVRNFVKNASFPEAITFGSRMVWSGDRRIIEFTRYGVGVESDMTVDGSGSLVYDVRRYVVRVPFLGLIVRIPTWLSPFGGGRTKEIGETEESFRVEFEMVHPLFGRTLGYTGRCWFESPE